MRKKREIMREEVHTLFTFKIIKKEKYCHVTQKEDIGLPYISFPLSYLRNR